MTDDKKYAPNLVNKKLTYSVPEAAEALGIGRSAAYQGVNSGEIPSIKIGSRIVIPKVALQQKLQDAGQTSSKAEHS